MYEIVQGGGYQGRFPETATRNGTYGDEGGPSRFFRVVESRLLANDPFVFQAKPNPNERSAGLGRKGNKHPTVKPVELVQHLASLLLPPDCIQGRRIMIPFAGSGSEMIGALRAGWDEIVGIELMPEYVEIAQKRLAYWHNWRMPTVDMFPELKPPGGMAAQLALLTGGDDEDQ